MGVECGFGFTITDCRGYMDVSDVSQAMQCQPSGTCNCGVESACDSHSGTDIQDCGPCCADTVCYKPTANQNKPFECKGDIYTDIGAKLYAKVLLEKYAMLLVQCKVCEHKQ